MLEVQGANILVEILNKFETWEWNLDLAVNIFLPIGQESAGCWHLLLCRRHNTEPLPLLEQPAWVVCNQLEMSTWIWLPGTADQPPFWKTAPKKLALWWSSLWKHGRTLSPQIFTKKKTEKSSLINTVAAFYIFLCKKSERLSFVQTSSV